MGTQSLSLAMWRSQESEGWQENNQTDRRLVAQLRRRKEPWRYSVADLLPSLWRKGKEIADIWPRSRSSRIALTSHYSCLCTQIQVSKTHWHSHGVQCPQCRGGRRDERWSENNTIKLLIWIKDSKQETELWTNTYRERA